MADKNPLLELIQSVGATAEMMKLFHSGFLRVGFSPADALELTKCVLQTQMVMGAARNGGNENGTD